MTFVVGENCIKCKYTDCVEVCPVDCFYVGPNFIVIHPDECIDCALCEPECPAEAIFAEDEIPEGQELFLELNAELAEVWPNITEQGECKYTDCVEVCPVDCFYVGPNFIVIHPDECIDCALCEPECPAEAIFAEDEIPEGQELFLELNAELAEVWPNITEQGEHPQDAEEWDGVKNKLQYLER